MTTVRLAGLAGLLAAATLANADLALAETPPLTEKINAAVGCLNRLSERSYQSRERYFSWAAKSGPTGKERIIYGTYTIYDTSDCRKKVEAANARDPHEPELEAAASAYAETVSALEPLLKEADDYYTQQNYKDDKMAKGRALHPRLVAAWDGFASADRKLRTSIDFFEDKLAVARLSEIELSEGKNARYNVMALMLSAKRLIRVQNGSGAPDLAQVTAALDAFEKSVKATEDFANANKDSKIGSMFISNAKTFLTTSKQLMRRVRDKVPYSSGDKMIMNSPGGAWMVEGSPARLTRDYNQLVDAFNRGANI